MNPAPFGFCCLALTLAAARVAGDDPLDGPPFVSCKAWVIADGKTGRIVDSHNADAKLPAASTTKIMCAYTVLQLAKADPRVMDETVVFSELADRTGGSTAGVKAGERVPVRECLYGLLLPSGNDAGNALAEYFHARLKPPAKVDEKERAALKTRLNFIAEMNRNAAKLGLKNTRYHSPYGDGGAKFTTTAADLAKLARAAMQEPLFRKYVSTQRYECKVAAADSSSRKVVWTNTNQLLKLGGYDGVKTGTTRSAGACLVSSGRRGDDHLFVVVLGATSTSGRYVDSRNLYRWAWKKRGHTK